jgi:hypothetical protein
MEHQFFVPSGYSHLFAPVKPGKGDDISLEFLDQCGEENVTLAAIFHHPGIGCLLTLGVKSGASF